MTRSAMSFALLVALSACSAGATDETVTAPPPGLPAPDDAVLGAPPSPAPEEATGDEPAPVIDPASEGPLAPTQADAGADATDPCAGRWEEEPNDDDPNRLGPLRCADVGPGDLDRFTLGAHKGEAVVLDVEADGAIEVKIDGACVQRVVLTGASQRVRLAPSKSCTVHVDVESDADHAYSIVREP